MSDSGMVERSVMLAWRETAEKRAARIAELEDKLQAQQDRLMRAEYNRDENSDRAMSFEVGLDITREALTTARRIIIEENVDLLSEEVRQIDEALAFSPPGPQKDPIETAVAKATDGVEEDLLG